jgi:hypothetical protein
VVTSYAFDCISPLISSCTTFGFLTMHLNSSEAEPKATGARLATGFGGAEYDVGVGKEKMEFGCLGGWYTGGDGGGVSPREGVGVVR